jgi:hypothetical protein
MLLHDNVRQHTAAHTRALLDHFNWELFDHWPPSLLLRVLISLGATTTFLPTWRTVWDYNASTIIRSWYKVPKHGSAHRRETSLTQAYKDFFPDMTNASIPEVTMLRSSSSMYIFLYIIQFYSRRLIC